MNARELRAALADLRLSQVELAQLIRISPRAISLWLSGEREVSGPAAAYLALLLSLPRALQAEETARIRKEDSAMPEGMYKFSFVGTTGTGLGVIILERGRVFGSDGAVQYDGTYEPSTDRRGYVSVHVHLTVPPGVPLVQGVPAQPMSYGFDIDCAFASRGTTPVSVQTPFGPVQGHIAFLRAVPA